MELLSGFSQLVPSFKKSNELFLKAEKGKNSKHIICELNCTRAHLEKLTALKTLWTILRSHTRWHEQGERSNKYFLNLEKQNYSKKLVSKLKLQNTSVLTNQFDILEKQVNFTNLIIIRKNLIAPTNLMMMCSLIPTTFQLCLTIIKLYVKL